MATSTTQFDALGTAQTDVVNQFLQGNLAVAYEKLMANVNPQVGRLNQETKKYYQTAEKAARAEVETDYQTAVRRTTIALVLAGSLLLTVTAFGWGMRRALVRKLARITQSKAASAEESASAAEELDSQAKALKGAVSELQLLVSGRLHTAQDAAPGPVTSVVPAAAKNGAGTNGSPAGTSIPGTGRNPAPAAQAPASALLR